MQNTLAIFGILSFWWDGDSSGKWWWSWWWFCGKGSCFRSYLVVLTTFKYFTNCNYKSAEADIWLWTENYQVEGVFLGDKSHRAKWMSIYYSIIANAKQNNLLCESCSFVWLNVPALIIITYYQSMFVSLGCLSGYNYHMIEFLLIISGRDCVV